VFRIDFSENSLEEFPIGLPRTLKQLYLYDNKIQVIPRETQPTLNNLTQLEELYLDDNQIKVIYDYQILPMTMLKWLGLQYNPLVSHKA